jgi:zinc-binding alcohol dehydrogenase family protein
MKAIGFHTFGQADVLTLVTIPAPQPQSRDLIVRIKAVSINPIDDKVRRGWHVHPLSGDPPPGTPVQNGPVIPGWDAAGIIDAVGAEVRGFRVGDEVYFAGDLTRQGSYAELVAVDERLVARKPTSLSFEQAAAVPLTALVVWEALFERMGIPETTADGTLLIVGGAGGVGSLAIQIAKRLTNLRVIATASRSESRDFCSRLGADVVIDHSQAYKPQLEAHGVAGVDYIFNCYETTILPQLSAVLNPLGTICCILPALEPLDPAALLDLFFKSARFTFELMYTRSLFGAAPERQGAILARVATLLDQQVLTSRETRVMNWAHVREAHRQIQTTHTMGKLVMTVDPAQSELSP